MAKVSNREDALLNAYMTRYKNAQASTVSEGQNKTSTARARGAAILNATDKTLPALKDTYSDTLSGIVQGASLENSLTNDILDRNLKLAKARFDQANDLNEQLQKAQQYAEKQAAKAAKAAAKSSGKSTSGSGSTGSGSTGGAGDADTATTLDALFGSGTAGTGSTAGSAAGSKPKAEETEKDKAKSEKEKSAQQLYLETKQAAANAGANKGKAAGNSYAERQNAAQPAQSRAVTRDGKVIGSSYAAAGSAPSERERTAAAQRKQQTADALKKLQTDSSYRTELAAPGRKLTSAEVAAVNQYEKSTKDTGFSGLKRVFDLAKNSDNLSKEEYAKKSAELNAELNRNSALRGKAQMNGAGQSAQAFTAGLYDSVPFLAKASDAMASAANATGLGAELPMLSKTLEDTKTYDPLAATAGTMVGKGMQYNLFNGAMAGTPLAQTMGKAGNAVVEQAQKIPVLGGILGAGAGDALGRILTDTTADLALDTLPSLVSDVSEGKSAGEVAGNTAKNIAGNIAMNALPEIGGAVFNRLKGTAGDAAQYVLKQADDAAQDVQSAGPARNIVQPEANGTTGLAAQIQQMNTPVAENRSALNTLDELRGQVNLNGAQEKEAEQLRRAVLQRQQEIGDEAKLALQNSDDLPIDAQRAAGYNEVNGGVQNDNLGAGVRADISLNADAGAGYEPQPGGGGSGLAGQTGTAGLSSTADGNGRGVQGPDAQDAGTVAEWARSITGKDRRSVYTRRIEDLYSRMQSGATRESMADEAKDIALGIVKDSDFAEPVDEATAALRDYLKSTPIRLDEKAAGDILYTNGLKNIQQYNFQNGTNFSTTSGLPYDTALMELADMGTGVSGSGVDDLLSAVAASNRGALVDTDQAAATADYYRDMILDGPAGRQAGTEDFTDWLEVQGFDSNMPDYTRRVYDRMFGGTDTAADTAAALPAAGQTAEDVSAARPLNSSESVPENAVGAESTQYNRSEVVNQDYANQRTMRGDMNGQTAAELGIGEQTHTVYSRAEGRDTAAQDFDVLVQQTGSVTEAGRTVADELNRKIQDGQWDASDVYAGSHAADQLRQRLAELPEGSAEADVVKAQIANLNRAVSAGQSKAGQALVSGRYAQPDEYSGIRRFEQYTQDSVDRFSHTRQGQQLHEVAQDVADTLNGPMDDEFTAFIHEQGIDTGDDVRDQLEYMADQIQRMGRAHNVDINEEQARAAAARAQAGGTVEDIYGAFARQALGIGDLSQEDLDYAVDTFRRIADMPDSRERYDLEMSVYNRMANYMPARGFADRLNNIRYLCMLGNTRTHIRNVMGNVMMGTVVRAKDNVAGMMQLALPENQRTKAVGTTLTADGRQMVNRAREYADSQMYTVLFQDGRWNMDTGLQAARNTYTTPIGRAIGRLSDINGGALEAEDNFFLRSEFGNSMASFLKARGYDSSIFDATDEHSRTVLRQAAAQALADAREATFHEDNFLSTAFRNFSNDTRQHGPAGQLAYAVTEGILPFKKTPINIAKNALEYNPIGGTVEAIYRGATGQGATRVMDAAAKGVTGTAILGAGYLLAKNGMLTGGGSGDDRADAYKEMTGEQNYAVRIPGKGTYTLDWASPASVPLLIGAQIAQDQEDDGEFNLTQTLDRFRQITQPVLETTMLQGLNDTLDSVSYADSNDKLATLATSALGSFANQFVPTALGQVARTVDDTRRSTYGGGDTKTERDVNYNIRKMENKIPGLSMNNEPYIDQWGREEASLDGADDTAGGMFLRGAYNMLSPGYVSAENVTPVDEYLQGLYDTTGDSTVLPEKAKSYLTLDGEKAYMTPEQKTRYAKTAGQTSYDIVDALRNESMFLKLPEDQQAEIVGSAYSVAKTAGGVEAVGDGVSGTNTKAYKAYEQGGTDGVVNYLLAKNAIDVARGDSDSITGAEKWTAISSAMDKDAAAEQYVLQQGTDSVAGRVYSYAGSNGLNAYMDAYSKVAAGLDEGKSPSRKDMSVALLKSGLSSDELAKTYLSAYKDDAKAASAYSSYGADGLKGWLQYYNAADLDGNGSVTQKEAQATLDQMDLTEQLKAAYWQMTNKSWKTSKNPY